VTLENAQVPDRYNLSRFLDAQEPVMSRVLAELRAGAKRSHWMWFIFPQIAGLGSSAMAQRYAIGSAAEARAFLDHAVLGPRLVQCTEIVTAVPGRSAAEIFGWPDDVKFRSSMTLFGHVAPDRAAFRTALVRFFDGQTDPETLRRLT
jgi:uncharacterized protein (DUF1810 family)